MILSRRKFVSSALASGAALAMPSTAISTATIQHRQTMAKRFPISIFSKNLQWLDYDGMAATAAELGFDGVDLTVRPNGHVLPERAADDLPKAFEAVKKVQLHMPSIVTAIDRADDVNTTRILETASKLKIPLYRLGWFHYESGKPIDKSLEDINNKLKAIDQLNQRLDVRGVHQNHSGQYYGAALWDYAGSLASIHSKKTGAQYDIYHAMIEGANSWIYGFERLAPYIWMINVKDYQWKKQNGKWVTETVPLGQGAVDWKQYFLLLKQHNIACPISLHYEYPIGGAEHGATQLTVAKTDVLKAMKQDLLFLKGLIAEIFSE